MHVSEDPITYGKCGFILGEYLESGFVEFFSDMLGDGLMDGIWDHDITTFVSTAPPYAYLVARFIIEMS